MLKKDTRFKQGESNELLINIRPKGNNALHHVFIVHLQLFIMKAWEISPHQKLFLSDTFDTEIALSVIKYAPADPKLTVVTTILTVDDAEEGVNVCSVPRAGEGRLPIA